MSLLDSQVTAPPGADLHRLGTSRLRELVNRRTIIVVGALGVAVVLIGILGGPVILAAAFAGIFAGLVLRSDALLAFSVIAFAAAKELQASIVFEHDSRLPILPGWSVSTTGVLGIVILGILVIRTVLVVRARPAVLREYAPLVLFIGFNILSLVWGGRFSLARGIQWIGYATTGFTLFLLTLSYADSPIRVRRLVIAFTGMLLVIAAASLVAGLTCRWEDTCDWATSPVSTLPYQIDGRGHRLEGIQGSPNILAGTVTVLMPLAMVPILSRDRSRAVIGVCVTALVLGLVALAWTESRSGIAGAVLAVAVLLWVTGKKWGIAALAAGGVALLLSPLGSHFLTGWQDVVLRGRDPRQAPGLLDAFGKLDVWSAAVNELTHPWTPFIGDGAGTTYARITELDSEGLQVWLDTGIVGVGLLVATLGVIAARIGTSLREAKSPLAHAVALAGLACLAAGLPRLAWDYLLNAQVGWLMLIACAMAISARRWAPVESDGRLVK